MAITVKNHRAVRPRTGGGRPAEPKPRVSAPLRPLLLIGCVLVAGLLCGLTLAPVFGAAGTAVKSLEEKLHPIHVDVATLFPPAPQRSTFIAGDGSIMTRVFIENRKIVPLGQVSKIAQRAILAIEDYRFYRHKGFDLEAIVRAALKNLEEGTVTQGGSTITQQLVKNVTKHKADTFMRKYREIQIAQQVEDFYSKDEILQLYLNEIFLGNGAYGIEAAANRYFDEHASKLNLVQSALIAGLIANPSIYDPLDHPDVALHRRNVVLQRMADIGWISQERADGAKAIPLRLAPSASEPIEQRQSFFVQFVRKLILLDPQHEFTVLGRTRLQREHTLYAGGLHIYTTLRPEWESYILKRINHYLPKPGDPQAGVATVEPGTGAVQALVPGRNFAQNQNDLVSGLPCSDSAIGFCGRHQTGSAFKPFTLVAAFREGFPPGKVYPSNAPAEDLREPCNDWAPNNAEGPGDLGYLDLYRATALSINAVFGRLAADVGPPNIADAAHDMGIPTNSPNFPDGPEDCSITLGTGIVSPLDMATAYATLANDGIYCPYYAVEKITGPGGKTLYQHDPKHSCHRAITSDIAHQVTDMLRGVIYGGTASAFGPLPDGRPVAGKTGTNEDFKDAWFVGYVPQEVTAVWVGYPGVPKPMLNVEGFAEVFGGTIPTEIWHDVMAHITANLPPTDFPEPPPPPVGEIPSVIGQSEEEALKTLAEANFTGVVEASRPSNEPIGTVIGQSPGAGTETTLGSLVHLTTSNGKPPKVQIPNVVGLPLEQAKQRLIAAGFKVTVLTTVTHEQSEDGIVLGQSPSGGKALEGATVVITVGKYEKPSPSPTETAPSPTETPSPSPSKTKKPHPSPSKTKKHRV